MYYVCKTIEVSASHKLQLDYDSPCGNLHGHNWKIKIWCKSETLNQNGMVVDFAHIKRVIHGKLDHSNLNEVVTFNPTAENLAKWITEQIPECYKVEIMESENNLAIYEISD